MIDLNKNGDKNKKQQLDNDELSLMKINIENDQENISQIDNKNYLNPKKLLKNDQTKVLDDINKINIKDEYVENFEDDINYYEFKNKMDQENKLLINENVKSITSKLLDKKYTDNPEYYRKGKSSQSNHLNRIVNEFPKSKSLSKTDMLINSIKSVYHVDMNKGVENVMEVNFKSNTNYKPTIINSNSNTNSIQTNKEDNINNKNMVKKLINKEKKLPKNQINFQVINQNLHLFSDSIRDKIFKNNTTTYKKDELSSKEIEFISNYYSKKDATKNVDLNRYNQFKSSIDTQKISKNNPNLDIKINHYNDNKLNSDYKKNISNNFLKMDAGNINKKNLYNPVIQKREVKSLNITSMPKIKMSSKSESNIVKSDIMKKIEKQDWKIFAKETEDERKKKPILINELQNYKDFMNQIDLEEKKFTFKKKNLTNNKNSSYTGIKNSNSFYNQVKIKDIKSSNSIQNSNKHQNSSNILRKQSIPKNSLKISLEDTYNHKEIFQKSVDKSDVNILEEKKNNQKPEKNEENNLLRKKENIKTPKKNKENIKSQENKKIKTPDNHEETIKIEKIQKIKTTKKNKEINIIENKEKVKTYDKEKEIKELSNKLKEIKRLNSNFEQKPINNNENQIKNQFQENQNIINLKENKSTNRLNNSDDLLNIPLQHTIKIDAGSEGFKNNFYSYFNFHLENKKSTKLENEETHLINPNSSELKIEDNLLDSINERLNETENFAKPSINHSVITIPKKETRSQNIDIMPEKVNFKIDSSVFDRFLSKIRKAVPNDIIPKEKSKTALKLFYEDSNKINNNPELISNLIELPKIFERIHQEKQKEIEENERKLNLNSIFKQEFQMFVQKFN